MKFKGLIAALAATVMALSAVTASADSFYDPEETYESIFQASYANGPIDLKDEITLYKQPTNSSCAATCAGMCIGVSPESLHNAGFNIDYADWYAIGSKYGYSVEWLGRSDLSGKNSLKVVYEYLKAGYPVCAWINQTNPHWVTIYKYTGNGTTFNASDFWCADPANSLPDYHRLDNSSYYAGVYNTVVFK